MGEVVLSLLLLLLLLLLVLLSLLADEWRSLFQSCPSTILVITESSCGPAREVIRDSKNKSEGVR